MRTQLNKVKKRRGSGWTYQETKSLLKLWIEFIVKPDVNKSNVNKIANNNNIYNRVSALLRSHQVVKSPDQCRERIKTLKRCYRHVLDSSDQGFDASQFVDDKFRFAEEMQVILNGKTDATSMNNAIQIVEVCKNIKFLFFCFVVFIPENSFLITEKL